MKKSKRILMSFVLALTMIFQTVSTFAENLVIASTQMDIRPAGELDYELLYKASGEAKLGCFEKIPILYKNIPVNEITVQFNKQYVNGVKTYKLEGETSVKLEAYAYKTGSNVKLAVLYGYYGYAGDPGDPGDPREKDVIWVQGFYEQSGQDDPIISSIDSEIWRNGSFENNQVKLDKCKEIIKSNNYSIKLNEIKFKDATTQTRELYWDATSLKNNNIITACTVHDSKPPAFITFANSKDIEITRTATPVSGAKNQWDVKLQIKNPLQQTKTIDTVIVLDVPNSNEAQGICKNTLDNVLNPLLQTPSSRVSIVLEGKEIINYTGPASIDENMLRELVQKEIKDNNKANTAELFNASSIQKARTILSSSQSPNKSIVIISYEGANCKGKSNGNSGNGSCAELTNEDAIVTQMGAASDEGIKIHTFAVHGDKGEKKTHTSPLQGVLQANTNGNFYATEFAQTSIKADSQSAMTEIATLINSKYNGETIDNISNMVFNDKLATQFSVISSNIEGVTIDENKTAIAWGIGQLNEGEEKTLTYRIEMKNGNIGTLYPISEQASLVYTDQKGTGISVNSIPNPSVKAEWAKITINSKDDKGRLLKKENNTPYEVVVWANVKEAMKDSVLQVNLSNPVDPSTMELKDNGTTTIGTYIIIPQYQCLGEEIEQNKYNLKPTIEVREINCNKTLFYASSISGTSDVDSEDKNLIVPASISNVFGSMTFDDEYKNISYEIDLSDIKAKTNNQVILNTFVLAAGINPGTFKKDVDYTLTSSGDIITLTFIDTEKTVSELTNNTMKQEITIYIPTQLSGSMLYSKGVGNYKDTYLGQKAHVTIIVKGRKRSIVQQVLEDGTIVNIVTYPSTASEIMRSTNPTTNTDIEVTFKEMPRIN